MASVTTKPQGPQLETETAAYLFDDWFDPIETGLREQVRAFIEELLRGELDAALARPRYARQIEHKEGALPGLVGHRHGSRTRTLTGTFGTQQITVPRARIERPDGAATEWKSQALRACQRRTVAADALIASTYLAGPIRAGCAARWWRCSVVRLARTW
jgi:putative transposase